MDSYTPNFFRVLELFTSFLILLTISLVKEHHLRINLVILLICIIQMKIDFKLVNQFLKPKTQPLIIILKNH